MLAYLYVAIRDRLFFFITLDRYFTARMMNQLLKFIMITNYNVARDQGTAIVESELIIF